MDIVCWCESGNRVDQFESMCITALNLYKIVNEDAVVNMIWHFRECEDATCIQEWAARLGVT